MPPPLAAMTRLVEHLGDGRLHALRDIEAAGYSRGLVARAVARGEVVQYARGVYATMDTLGVDGVSLAALTLLNPGAVVCLLSAAQVHEISDEDPPRIWMAVDRDRTTHPLRDAPCLPVRTVWWRPGLLRDGIEEREIAGVTVSITTPARTVVDLLRLRGRLGDEPAMKALHDYVRSGARVGDLWDVAKTIGHLRAVEPFVRAAEAFRETMPIRRPS